MAFMASIIHWLNEVSSYFYDLYIEVLGWPEPFWRVYAPFYFLSTTFSSLAWQFYYFSDWVNGVAVQLSYILDWGTIWSYILSYVPNLVEISNWFYDWSGHVLTFVDTWWSSTQYTVLEWISNLENWTTAQINNLRDTILATIADLETWTVAQLNGVSNTILTMITNVQLWTTAQLDNLRGIIIGLLSDLESWTQTEINSLQAMLATLVDWTAFYSWITAWWNDRLLDVQGLIDSAFLARDSLWSGWQDWRDQVAEFFTDPEDWLYKSVDRIVERFW